MAIINENDYDFDKNGAGKVVGVTVKALREALAELPDDLLVVISRDAEGNSYSPLAMVDFEETDGGLIYSAETTWMGEVSSPRFRAEVREEGLNPGSGVEDDEAACIVLVPIN